jgi:hypothetical protein
MTEDSPGHKGRHAERVRRKPTLNQQQEDMLDWLDWETANVMREAQLRIQDATEFTTRFASGRMGKEELDKRYSAYASRWPDPLKGVADSRGMTDEAIYEAMARIGEKDVQSREELRRQIEGRGPSR